MGKIVLKYEGEDGVERDEDLGMISKEWGDELEKHYDLNKELEVLDVKGLIDVFLKKDEFESAEIEHIDKGHVMMEQKRELMLEWTNWIEKENHMEVRVH